MADGQLAGRDRLPRRTISRSLTSSMWPKRSVRSVSSVARSGPVAATTDGSRAIEVCAVHVAVAAKAVQRADVCVIFLQSTVSWT